MKTYTPEQVERIVRLRELRIELLKSHEKDTSKRLRSVNGQLWQLTNNSIYR